MTVRSAAGRVVARVRSRLRRSKTGEPRYDPSGVENEHVVLGAEDDPRHDVPETEAGKIASIFADVIEGGDLAELGDLLADEVVYLVPGRSGAAGLHHGHEAVAQTLAQETSEDTTVSIVEVTEVIAAGTRAVVVVRFAGTVGGEPFDHETVFHLRTSNGVVVAITEYSGDQYRADRVARRR
ncbi:MAG: hypothetical protein GY745_08605 [Actinomycetia bacterium]|nr:hypothetical protein [Actinomycetes bacterium]